MYQQLERKEKQLAVQQPKIQRKEKTNRTGLPDNLKDGIERLSGFDMSDVRVHYNSSKPAQLNAHAYAQGNQIHLGAGQERHLPHEAWHVVQQKQGRVRPTMTMNGQEINDNVGLEKEADVMGGKALQMKRISVIQKVRKQNDIEVHQLKMDSNISSQNQVIQLETWKEWAKRHKIKIGLGLLTIASIGAYILCNRNKGTDKALIGNAKELANTVKDTLVTASTSEIEKAPSNVTKLMSELVSRTTDATLNEVADTLAGNSIPSITRGTYQALARGLDAAEALDFAVSDPTHFGL